jgi:phosphoribosyl 1,2-cyclic phosphodiesterase
MKVRLWGVRGSLGSAGASTVRYGGNTACVEVRPSPDHLIVLDAGSGIRALGTTVTDEVRKIDVLITHLHMDHIQGIGFFAPLFSRRAEVDIWGPPSIRASLHQRLTRYLSPPLFPVELRDMAARPRLHDAPTHEPVRLGRVEVSAALVVHPGPTVGYRIMSTDATVAYLPDHEPGLGGRGPLEPLPWLSGGGLALGADLLIHDAQYTPDEYALRVGWGHSTLDHAVAFAQLTGARRLVTFHHDPGHDDDTLDSSARTLTVPDGLTVVPGREGATFDVR